MINSRPASSDDPAGDDLVDALARTAFATMATLTRVGAESDLSLTQVRVLGILRDRCLRMSALADYLGLERSTLSGLVDRAEERGLLKRERDPDDGRVVTVALASEGAALASRAAGHVRQGLSVMTSRLSPGERAELRRLLEKLLAEAKEVLPHQPVPGQHPGGSRPFRGTGASTLPYPGYRGTLPALCHLLAVMQGPVPRVRFRGDGLPAPE